MTEPARCSDPVAQPVMTALLAALRAVFAEEAEADDTIVEPCDFVYLPGAIPVLDLALGCPEGIAWIRLVDVSPTTWAAFPAPVATAAVGPLSYAVAVEIGVARGAPVGRLEGENYYPASVEEERAAADRATVDAAIVRHTILERYPADNDDPGVALGSYGPIGPEGDVVGGATLCTVFVP